MKTRNPGSGISKENGGECENESMHWMRDVENKHRAVTGLREYARSTLSPRQ